VSSHGEHFLYPPFGGDKKKGKEVEEMEKGESWPRNPRTKAFYRTHPVHVFVK
jgi:hypothetical protein